MEGKERGGGLYRRGGTGEKAERRREREGEGGNRRKMLNYSGHR